jgi:LPXTG-motif cell wall-anchored protein
VSLGAADNFAVLASSTVTNTGASLVNGDLGLSPGTSVTGFPPSAVLGIQHVADTAASNAQASLITAYNNAAGQGPATPIVSNLGGQTLTPGVYGSSTSIALTGNLILNAQGDPNAVFVFQAGSTLTTASSSSVTLINGAQACNTFWEIGSSATLGTNSTFKGNIMAQASITLTTGANVEGRVLARTGAVTMDTNIINRAVCAVPPTPSASVTPTPTPSVTPVPPLINIVKTPSPLALPSGPGSVTYGYSVTNPGTVALSNVTVTDDKCSPVGFVSGDTNSNNLLDVTETWHYSCTTTVSQTTTNTATATGQANGFTAVDTANATVVVGLASPPPLINVVKKPSVFNLPAGGGAVTYTYTVTNLGTVPLSNVSVVDNKCSPVSSPTGDINSNSQLDTSETWVYTCQTTLTATTANTAIAEGSANGLTAIDFSLATVLVPPSPSASPVPKLPNTGAGSNDKSGILWGAIVLAAALFSVLTLTRKQQAGANRLS